MDFGHLFIYYFVWYEIQTLKKERQGTIFLKKMYNTIYLPFLAKNIILLKLFYIKSYKKFLNSVLL